MRTPFICGNWKMNLVPHEAAAFARKLTQHFWQTEGVDIGIAPAFLALAPVRAALGETRIKLMAQNCHWAGQGAFTGEVSAPMLKAIGCDGAIIGHSERRQLFGETDETVRDRTKAALAEGLLPIVCVGETLAEREAGKTLDVVGRQVRAVFSALTAEQTGQCVVAYEPVWAIGTGKVATTTQIQEVHSAIRGMVGEEVRIQYGGSVKADNAAEILRLPDVDGALVGGASLKADEFAKIVAAAKR